MSAVVQLIEMGPRAKEAVPALAEAMQDKSFLVRCMTASALGRLGPDAEAAVPALTALLKDNDAHLRSEAAWALGEIGPQARSALPALQVLHPPNPAEQGNNKAFDLPGTSDTLGRLAAVRRTARALSRKVRSMADIVAGVCPELETALWQLYRDFFDKAEKKRRWSIRDDIPWDQCNPRLNPAVADVVESFCAVEMYLPDYTSRILPVVRPSKGRTWFYANWGYEESKHSLALSDWLLRSGMRTDEQMADLESNVFRREWNLPHDSHLGMLVYAMVQELATWLNYRNVRNGLAAAGGDPALEKLLMYVAVDERAHYAFFQECLELYLKHDRAAVLEQMRRVMNNFSMPAINDLVDGPQRVARVKALGIFDEDIYYREVYLPTLVDMGVERSEMRNRLPRSKTQPVVS